MFISSMSSYVSDTHTRAEVAGVLSATFFIPLTIITAKSSVLYISEIAQSPCITGNSRKTDDMSK